MQTLLSVVFLFLLIEKSVINAEMNLEEVAEGPCVVPVLSNDIDSTFVTATRMWFTPLASNWTYLHYAEVLLGRPARDILELEELCLIMEVVEDSMKTKGYGRTIEQKCELEGPSGAGGSSASVRKCTVTPDPEIKTSLLDDFREYAVMTDNTNYILSVRCINGVRSYRVASTVPTISPRLLGEIRRKIVELGFQESLLQRLPCKPVCSSKSSDTVMVNAQKLFEIENTIVVNVTSSPVD